MGNNDKAKHKVYGREARLRAILERLQNAPDSLPDGCIDLMYSILYNFLT